MIISALHAAEPVLAGYRQISNAGKKKDSATAEGHFIQSLMDHTPDLQEFVYNRAVESVVSVSQCVPSFPKKQEIKSIMYV